MKLPKLIVVGMLLFVIAAVAQGATAYTYDELNRLTKVVYDDGRSISYTYDAAGNLTLREAKASNPDAGLVGHWSFDDCSARDSGPQAQHGSISGAPACVSGRVGSALRFNGSTDWITVPSSASFPRTAITIAYWLNREGNVVGSTLQNYISKNLAFQSYLMSNNALTAGLWLGSPGLWNEYGGTTANLPTSSGWVHFAFTFDNTTRRAKTYVDGVLVEDKQELDARALVRSSNQALFLGRNGSSNVFHIRGLLDEVRLYDRALTDSEIEQLVPGFARLNMSREKWLWGNNVWQSPDRLPVCGVNWFRPGDGGTGKTLLQFDHAQVPTSASRVFLNLHTLSWDNRGGSTAEVYPVQQIWDPATVVWQTIPSHSATPAAVFPLPANAPEGWVKVDITSLVRSWQGGAANHGMLIDSRINPWSYCRAFYSSVVPAKRPHLSWE